MGKGGAFLKKTVYLETTIPSYLAAHTSSNLIVAGDQAVTHKFFNRERDQYDLYISRYVLQECEKGDPDAAERRLSWLRGITVLNETPDVFTMSLT